MAGPLGLRKVYEMSSKTTGALTLYAKVVSLDFILSGEKK